MRENEMLPSGDLQNEMLSLDELEAKLYGELEGQLSGLEFLEKEREKISDPEGLGETIGNAVWEQFILQIGPLAGRDFIKSNNGKTADLRDKAHIQTTENFEKGIIATHNEIIDYQQRYDDWQFNFKRDEGENIKNTEKATLIEGARADFDKKRPRGSGKQGTDMDHTISASEIIRDAHTNAHLSRKEQIAFANSDKNLNEMRSDLNRSKNDTPMEEWLDNPKQKPAERFNISKEEEKELRAKDKEAREEYAKVKEKGEERSIETGRKSQLREAGRIGGQALRAVLMGLLADFLRVVIKKLVSWFRSGERKLGTFIDQFKEAWGEFWANLKTHLVNAGETLLSTIVTTVFGPIKSVFTKLWTVLKTGWRSLKDAIAYIKNPENRNKPFSILMLEAGKIVVAGLSAIGTLALGEVIEKKLILAGLGIQIPLLGSLASIIGMFIAAVVSGVIGAIVLRWIDKLIANKLKNENIKQQLSQQNEIRESQEKLIVVKEVQLDNTKETVARSIVERHNLAAEIVQEKMNNILNRSNYINTPKDKDIIDVTRTKNDDDLDKLFEDLNKL
jgi:cation diffusion facilitator family transporter